MKWTSELPTEPGYYWWRVSDVEPPTIFRVSAPDHNGRTWVHATLYVIKEGGEGMRSGTIDELGGGEWMGPLAPEGWKASDALDPYM
jgi:hypothetical protein